MPNIRTLLVVAVLSLMGNGTAHGREMAGKIGITPRLGINIPTGEFLSPRGLGYSHGLELEYFYANNAALALRVFYDYYSTTNDNTIPESVFRDSYYTWPVYGLGAHIKYFLTATPYTDVFGEIGFLLGQMETPIYSWRSEWGDSYRHEKITSAGFSAGTGLSRHLSRLLAVHGNFAYNLLFTKGKRLIDESWYPGYHDTCDYNAQWLAVRLGLTFYLGGGK